MAELLIREKEAILEANSADMANSDPADRAMYDAKRDGRNRVRRYDPSTPSR